MVAKIQTDSSNVINSHWRKCCGYFWWTANVSYCNVPYHRARLSTRTLIRIMLVIYTNMILKLLPNGVDDGSTRQKHGFSQGKNGCEFLFQDVHRDLNCTSFRWKYFCLYAMTVASEKTSVKCTNWDIKSTTWPRVHRKIKSYTTLNQFNDS